MSLVATCECGAQFTVKSRYAGKRVRCKRCGGPAHVPHHNQGTPVTSSVRPATVESNPLVIIGFVFAMLGFCFATLTAPIGLGCSIVGLRRRANHGLAVAGAAAQDRVEAGSRGRRSRRVHRPRLANLSLLHRRGQALGQAAVGEDHPGLVFPRGSRRRLSSPPDVRYHDGVG